MKMSLFFIVRNFLPSFFLFLFCAFSYAATSTSKCTDRSISEEFLDSLPSSKGLRKLKRKTPFLNESNVWEKEVVVKKELNLDKKEESKSENENRLSLIPEVFTFNKKDSIKIVFGNTASDGRNSNQLVSSKLVSSLEQALKEANEVLPKDYRIFEIYISSTTNGRHSSNSNHYHGTAVDISRINGIRMTQLGSNIQIRELQNALDRTPLIRENYGPFAKNKTYLDGSRSESLYIRGHRDHIHFAIQGDHNAEACDCRDSVDYLGKINETAEEDDNI